MSGDFGEREDMYGEVIDILLLTLWLYVHLEEKSEIGK